MDASPITPDLDEALRYAGVRADESGDMHRKIGGNCRAVHEKRHAALHLPRVRNRVGKRDAVALWRAACLPGRTAAVMLRSCSTRRCLSAPSARRSMRWRGRYRRGILRMRCCWTASAARMSKRAATRRSAKSPRSCPVSTSPTASAPATAICRWTCKVRCWR